ncbi:MAG: toprim domain-containing protein [Methylococcales bacterium]|nr:toprim domain-containing protein [Methylococcales bacterium]
MEIREVENQFIGTMADAGMTVREAIIADGKLHRVYVEGDRRGTKNGAYVLHANHNPAGWYLHFKTGITGKWTPKGKCVPMSLDMRIKTEAVCKQQAAEQQERQTEAATKAVLIWSKASPIAEQHQHPYLIKKSIQPYRVRMYRGSLVIRMYDSNKQIVNLQFIDAEGNKRFLSGGKKKCCFSVIGDKLGKTLLICEGYATGASLHQATRLFIVVALDAGNLAHVALVMRNLYPNDQIIIAGDNDKSGTGQKAARSAALAVGGKYILPDKIGYDWNDMLNATEVA